MANTVKTWRVATDKLKVGNSSRLFGELIPEAADWAPHTQAAYERSGAIEKVFVSQEEFDEFKKKHSPEEKKTVKKAAKKRVVKKKTTAKKEKASGERNAEVQEEEGPRGTEGTELAEVAV